MNTYRTIVEAVLPVFGLIGCGFWLRQREWLSRDADASLLRLTLSIFVPCLILDSALGNAALHRWQNVWWAPASGFLTVGLSLFVAHLACRWHGLKDPVAARTFRVSVALHNYGYIPLPLCLLLFDTSTAGVLFLYMTGVEVALWTLGVAGLSGRTCRLPWRRVLNPPLIAVVAALLVNVWQGHAWIPGPFRTGLHWLGQCAVPTALLLIGAVIADELGECRVRVGWRVMAVAVCIRLGLLPWLFLAMARWLPISPELQRVLVLESAMPAAVFPIVMARHYGGHVPTAMQVVLSTSLVSLVTIPWWIQWGLNWLGLAPN
ncbi:MAG: AEC family transporter [Verrucomicrobiota bacterium]|nr:AEC family transporter [Limisphaera sp.]MDW8381020.1 AEC family transporter [Verrucomicrobiota bacterium]